MSTEDQGDSSEARQWIEDLRRRRGYGKRFQWSQDVDNLIESLPEGDRAAARAVWKERVGRPVAEILDEQFDQDIAGIKLVLDGDDLNLLRHVHVALFPSYDFGAHLGTAPSGNRILAIHTGLPHTLIAWARVFTGLVERGGMLDEIGLNEHAELVVYLAGVWQGGFHTGRAFGPLEQENSRLHEELANAAQCFVVAHEIGHLRLKHARYTRNRSENHEMEYAADSHGLGVAVRYALLHAARYDDSYFLKFMLFGPFLALGLLCLLGDQDSDTHPSATRRVERIISSQEDVFRRLLADKADYYLDFLDHDIFGLLGNNARNLLLLCQSLQPLMQASLKRDPMPPTRLFRRL